jgi:hypothetical protein
MKELNMKISTPKLYCQNCGLPLFYVKHIEDDGFDGSDESYFECPDGCDEPLEDLIDTCTEFGVIITYQNEPNKLSIII